jgi:DNA adenine methylase
MKVIKYFGGKGGVFVKKILSMLPKRDIYIEPFGGSATILLSQKSNVEIYNDIYDNVYNLMKVLQDERLFEQFCRKLELSYYCEKMRGEAKEILKAKDVDAVMKAWAYFLLQ